MPCVCTFKVSFINAGIFQLHDIIILLLMRCLCEKKVVGIYRQVVRQYEKFHFLLIHNITVEMLDFIFAITLWWWIAMSKFVFIVHRITMVWNGSSICQNSFSHINNLINWKPLLINTFVRLLFKTKDKNMIQETLFWKQNYVSLCSETGTL
jgi:hypothetical protein